MWELEREAKRPLCGVAVANGGKHRTTQGTQDLRTGRVSGERGGGALREALQEGEILELGLKAGTAPCMGNSIGKGMG